MAVLSTHERSEQMRQDILIKNNLSFVHSFFTLKDIIDNIHRYSLQGVIFLEHECLGNTFVEMETSLALLRKYNLRIFINEEEIFDDVLSNFKSRIIMTAIDFNNQAKNINNNTNTRFQQ